MKSIANGFLNLKYVDLFEAVCHNTYGESSFPTTRIETF